MSGRNAGQDDAHGYIGGSIHYPESLRAIVPHLSELLGPDIRSPAVFDSHVPVIVDQVTAFFEAVHGAHDRARAVLESGELYCLYLRDFALAGENGSVEQGDDGKLYQNIHLTPSDGGAEAFLAQALDGVTPVVSCFNTLNAWGINKAVAQGVEIASLRLLTHNWQATLASLIDGARSIVMIRSPSLAGDGGDGVQFELKALLALGQGPRTVMVYDGAGQQGRLLDAPKGLHAHFGLNTAMLEKGGPESDDLAQCVRALAGDGFRRERLTPPVEIPPCRVVDKGYGPEHFSGGGYAVSDYPLLIPESLQEAAEALQNNMPLLLERWEKIEESIGPDLDREAVAQSLAVALDCFVAGTVIEDYRAMAFALSVAGGAHHLLSGRAELHKQCIDAANRLMQWDWRPDFPAPGR
ncbi:MAG: hypothetical protein R3C52_12185 [Hyphomonadaceae bacterium]